MFLLHISVNANELDEKFLDKVKDVLFNSMDTTDDNDATLPMIDILPTPIDGAKNLELPAFRYKSAAQIQLRGLDIYTCTYNFEQGDSSYYL